MSDAAEPETEPPETEASEPERQPRLRRDAQLLGRRNSAVREFLRRKIEAVIRGFQDQASRSDDLDNWWNIYNCALDDNQFYNGNAQVYVPIIRDAIDARSTRFANQLFPQSGKYVEATASDGTTPLEIIALVHHYIRTEQLKTQIVRPLLVNGDIEGQYNLYVDWNEVERLIVSRETKEATDPQSGMAIPGEEIDDITEEEVLEGRPCFEVLHDSDVLVIPAKADTIERALMAGGSITIVRRWSTDKFDRMSDAGEIKFPYESDDAKNVDPGLSGLNDLQKDLAKAIGIRAAGKHIVMFETWLFVPLSAKGDYSEKGSKRLCRLWWDIDREPGGLKRNPFWNDRCPLLSKPVKKVAGIFKGQSQVAPLAPLQYEANDAANERADVDHYGAMPIIRRTPETGNAPFILNLAAVWDAKPGDVEFLAFPDLSQRANARIMAATQVIFQSLGINPAMLPQQTGRPGAKRNQAEIAMEQQVDILTVAEAVEVPETILNEAVEWMVDLDHQFRDRELTVREYGELGLRANMIEVKPLHTRTRYTFQWSGAQQAKQNAAMLQQGTGFLNVAMQPAIQQLLKSEGFEFHPSSLLMKQAAELFGPVVASQVIVDKRRQLAVDPEIENEMLAEGFDVPVQALDEDQKHLMAHQKAMQETGDPTGTFKVHMMKHMMQMKMKQAAMMMQQLAQAVQGQGAQPGAGRAGPPRPGAAPAGPRLVSQQPPGAIRPDNMSGAGALTMPRRT